MASGDLPTLVHRLYRTLDRPLPLTEAADFLRIANLALVAAMATQLNFLFPDPSPHSGLFHPERQYLGLMKRIWAEGSQRVDRTGIGTKSLLGATMRFDLGGGKMPLLTTKRVYWKTATRELLWFLTGETNIRPLVLQGVKIWNDWPHARYVRETGEQLELDLFVARIAEDEAFAERWGDLGPVYGKQWVDWAVYEPANDGQIGRAHV